MRRFLVFNLGSSSEKFSLFWGEEEVDSLYFEEASGKLGEAKRIFEEKGLIDKEHPLDGILIRVVAAGGYFAKSHVVDVQTFDELKKARLINPLHVPRVERGIKNALEMFEGVPVIVISDSEVLVGDSRRDMEYALPEEIAREFDLKRWGAHGVSYGYMMDKITELGLMREKMVICHLGSGCSATAFESGRPVYTSMGETPLEGLMSSSRAGSVDPMIGALLAEKVGVAEAIEVLNKQSGLLAVGGSENMLTVVTRAQEGDLQAAKAYNMFVDGVAGKIGELAAKMGGIDALVFTGTIGERSEPVRKSVVQKLGFMGFAIRDGVVFDDVRGYMDLSGEGSKPVYMVPTNEAVYMVKKADELLDNMARVEV